MLAFSAHGAHMSTYLNITRPAPFQALWIFSARVLQTAGSVTAAAEVRSWYVEEEHVETCVLFVCFHPSSDGLHPSSEVHCFVSVRVKEAHKASLDITLHCFHLVCFSRSPGYVKLDCSSAEGRCFIPQLAQRAWDWSKDHSLVDDLQHVWRILEILKSGDLPNPDCNMMRPDHVVLFLRDRGLDQEGYSWTMEHNMILM